MLDEERRLTIERLEIEKFKGVEGFVFDLDGRDATVYGDNGVGKTTLADAWTWLLWGKDSRGRTDFAIKTIQSDGGRNDGVEYAVSATVSLPSDRRVKMRRVYREVWTKHRGRAKAIMTGHETACEIDGVPTTRGDYDAFVAQLADEETWRVLTDPTYFSDGLHWQDRRRVLLDAIGDVSDLDVIESTPQLADLREVVESGRGVSDHRRVVERDRKKLNQEIERIPVRIDEVRRGVPSGVSDSGAITARINELRVARRDLESRRAEAAAGGRIAELRVALKELDIEIAEVREAQLAEREQIVSESADAVDVAVEAVRSAERAVESTVRERAELTGEMERLESRVATKREAWSEVDAEVFEIVLDEACPTCGQELPSDKIAAALREAEDAWLAAKAERLREITEDGRAIAVHVDEVRRRIAATDETMRDAKDELVATTASLNVARDAHDEATRAANEVTRVTETENSDFERRRVETVAEIARHKGDRDAAVREIETEIDESRQAIAEAEGDLARVEQADRAAARVTELEEDERRLAAAFEEAERQLYLCDLFTRTKTAMLEESVNSQFELARFKLFRELVRGGVEECCETTDLHGVPYGAGLNDGARTNVGLDVVRTLSRLLVFAPPVWVDHAESTTRLIDVPAQMIRLAVREGADRLLVSRDDAVEDATATPRHV